VERLNGIEDAPWAEWRGGRGLTPASLGKLLSAFNVESRQTWVGNRERKARLYHLADLKPVFDVYLHFTAVHAVQPTKNAVETHISQRGTDPLVPRYENSESINKNAGCTACTAVELENTAFGRNGSNGNQNQKPSRVPRLAFCTPEWGGGEEDLACHVPREQSTPVAVAVREPEMGDSEWQPIVGNLCVPPQAEQKRDGDSGNTSGANGHSMPSCSECGSYALCGGDCQTCGAAQ
jgi:hypothetical protein